MKPITLVSLFLVLDQTIKSFILSIFMFAKHNISSFSPFFDVYLTCNPGVSFSLMSSMPEACLLSLSTAIFIGLFPLKLTKKLSPARNTLLTSAALSCLVSGAISNSLDRIYYGFVIDFLDFHLEDFNFLQFNSSDILITLGVASILKDRLRLRFLASRYKPSCDEQITQLVYSSLPQGAHQFRRGP